MSTPDKASPTAIAVAIVVVLTPIVMIAHIISPKKKTR